MTDDVAAANAEHVALLRNVLGLGSLDDTILKQIAQTAQHKTVKRGEVLIKEGDLASSFYIVLKGRFVVLFGQTPIAEISMGEPIGELAFFAGGPRTATVVAARNSTVLSLTRDAYDTLAEATPEISSGIIKALSERLARSVSDQPKLPPKAGKVCSVFPGGQSPMSRGFLEGLKTAFADVPGWALVEASQYPGTADDLGALTRWLEHQEAEFGNLVVLCSDPKSEPVWCRAAADFSDTVMIALDISEKLRDNMEPSALELELLGATLPNSIQLALYRPDTRASTRGTAPWLEKRNVAMHHHVALDDAPSFQRLGRFIRGEALGLVMCGGGSLGTAHLGAIQAIRERGYDFDCIGGTSVGSAMGAALAIGLDPGDVMDLCEDIFIKSKAMSRLTIPKHSLLDHHTLDAALMHHYRGYAIEDVPLNFFANATSLTHNDTRVLRDGPLWEAVRASCSLPGIFPPFIREDGEVLIDGGLLDNAPITAMRNLKAGPNLVLNFLPSNPWRVNANYGDLPTRRQAVTSLLKRKSKGKARHPSVMSTLSRAMVVNARKLMQTTDLGDDVLMNISTLRGMSYLDWKRGRELFNFAHQQMSEALDKTADAGAADPLMHLRHAAEIINLRD